MPIYAFECTGCGHHFERLQRLSDADPSECPECQSSKVRRQLTAPSFRLAGGGWYETDFKKDGKKNLAEKSESKPEAKPAAEASKPATPKTGE
jgi:putative FmdB family regulatory protein